MRTEQEILDLIMHVATADERIRAVVLNGSRANPDVKKDHLRDFDIVCFVHHINSFLDNHYWINIFGERIILQVPKMMDIGETNKDPSFQYLMLFKDGNRIDLTLFPVNKIKSDYVKDSLTMVLLDKDKLFADLPEPSQKDYLIKPPAEKEFLDCCNEFWWVSTYVAKGLLRNQVTYAKEILEIPVRNMFMKMIEWYIGLQTHFSVSFGKAGKNMQIHLHRTLYKKILSTYPDAEKENIWQAVFEMAVLFSEFAHETANAMNFKYHEEEEKNVMEYLKKVYENS
ncbi:MAG TPA: aminoglycoside 6-adenylyltransferase [Puia sp.]|nr:aminoglycoside 6-adenylyltransferase [Puia sp.]